MCRKFTMLAWDDVLGVVQALEASAPLNLQPDWPACRDAVPGSEACVVAAGSGALEPLRLTWGFPLSGSGKLVFNTRSENAASSPLWRDAFLNRRCIVPAWAFFESHRTETERGASGRPRRRQYRFLPEGGGGPLLMAGIWQDRRFSVLTCAPDDRVRPVHDRMPLLLSASSALDWAAGAAPEECRSAVALEASTQSGRPPLDGGDGCDVGGAGAQMALF